MRSERQKQRRFVANDTLLSEKSQRKIDVAE